MRHAAIAFFLLVSQQAAPKPSFEVATIKRNASVDANGAAGFVAGGRFRATNVDVQTLIRVAYRTGATQMLPSQVIGGPDWLSSTYYDITAKVNGELTGKPPAELLPLQPL